MYKISQQWMVVCRWFWMVTTMLVTGACGLASSEAAQVSLGANTAGPFATTQIQPLDGDRGFSFRFVVSEGEIASLKCAAEVVRPIHDPNFSACIFDACPNPSNPRECTGTVPTAYVNRMSRFSLHATLKDGRYVETNREAFYNILPVQSSSSLVFENSRLVMNFPQGAFLPGTKYLGMLRDVPPGLLPDTLKQLTSVFQISTNPQGGVRGSTTLSIYYSVDDLGAAGLNQGLADRAKIHLRRWNAASQAWDVVPSQWVPSRAYYEVGGHKATVTQAQGIYALMVTVVPPRLRTIKAETIAGSAIQPCAANDIRVARVVDPAVEVDVACGTHYLRYRVGTEFSLTPLQPLFIQNLAPGKADHLSDDVDLASADARAFVFDHQAQSGGRLGWKFEKSQQGDAMTPKEIFLPARVRGRPVKAVSRGGRTFVAMAFGTHRLWVLNAEGDNIAAVPSENVTPVDIAATDTRLYLLGRFVAPGTGEARMGIEVFDITGNMPIREPHTIYLDHQDAVSLALYEEFAYVGHTTTHALTTIHLPTGRVTSVTTEDVPRRLFAVKVEDLPVLVVQTMDEKVTVYSIYEPHNPIARGVLDPIFTGFRQLAFATNAASEVLMVASYPGSILQQENIDFMSVFRLRIR